MRPRGDREEEQESRVGRSRAGADPARQEQEEAQGREHAGPAERDEPHRARKERGLSRRAVDGQEPPRGVLRGDEEPRPVEEEDSRTLARGRGAHGAPGGVLDGDGGAGGVDEGDDGATPQNESGKLGLSLQPVTPKLAQQLGLDENQGLVVTDVDGSGPAAEAGISRGDVIIEINRKPVNSVADARRPLRTRGTNRLRCL